MKCSRFLILLITSVALLTGCAKATIRPDGTARISQDKPDFTSSEPFFIGGLVGGSEIELREVCGDGNVEQMQTQFTFVDSILTIVTVGIYSPKTARVWCAK